jgi:hypothetical protein
LGGVDCDAADCRGGEEIVEVTDPVGPGLGEHHDRSLDERRRRDERVVSLRQQIDETVALGLGLAEQDRNQRRGVNDHQAGRQPGRPSGP